MFRGVYASLRLPTVGNGCAVAELSRTAELAQYQ